ncbi:MAG: type sorting protein, partial [Mucilaginibacter sp.]|nr:type sorting protein [Mucilaginibacter sp.]
MRKFRTICRSGVLKPVLVGLILLCSVGKACATNNWLGGTVLGLHLGGSGDWNTAGNWSNGNVPTTSDDVVISELLAGFTISLSGPATAKSISINTTIALLTGVVINTSGQTLTVANSLNVGAVSILLATPLTITGSGAVTLNNAINVYPYANLTFSSGTNVTISGATVTCYNNSTINCNGTLSANSSIFNISGSNSGIANTGTFNLGTASTINLTGTSASVSNTGTFTLLSNVTGSATIGPISSGTTGFSGQYSVQRFFTGGSTYSNGRWVYRNYRLMSSPVNAGLVSGNYPYTLNYVAASAIVSGA